jgi:histone H3/H4
MGRDFSIFTENPNVDESLVVASKVKKYIKDKEGLSTSSQAFDQLTYRVQKACLQAIENAKSAKRKTVMDRDFQEPNNA